MTALLFGIYQIFKKPWIFFITTAMLTISLVVSVYSLVVYDAYHYPTRQAQKVLNYDMGDVYKIEFGFSVLGIRLEDIDDVETLLMGLEEITGISSWGGYYFNNNDKENKLYVNQSLIDLCDIKGADNKELKYDYFGIEKNYGIAFIGEELSERYPIGSVYLDEETGCQYMVVDIVKKDSLWLPDSLFGGSAVNLNDCIILDLDYATEKKDNKLYLFNACNNLLFVGRDSGVKDEVEAIIKSTGLDISGIFSLEELYSSYEKEAMDRAGEDYLLPLILLTSAIIVSVITSKMSLLSNKKDYGIMISNGFTKANLIGIVVSENLIKCVCSYMICCLYWEIQYINMDSFTRVLYTDMRGFRILIFVIVCVLSCQYPVRYLLKIKPTELINRREL